jgi:hypothetical protein
MIVFAVSDKGGTGRSVTACNLAYQLSVRGLDVAYLDFDFASPTAGAIFELEDVSLGAAERGLHSYVLGETEDPVAYDIWRFSSNTKLKTLHVNAGRMVLYPGDRGGAEFTTADPQQILRVDMLFRQVLDEFNICIVDLSAGRSRACELVLSATARSELCDEDVRWLVFHRWTHQHLIAADGLVFGKQGILDIGAGANHDQQRLRQSIKFVRTAVPDLDNPGATERGTQAQWLHTRNEALEREAGRRGMGKTALLATTPMEPVLQWREQIILESDVTDGIANGKTLRVFQKMANDLITPRVWRKR